MRVTNWAGNVEFAAARVHRPSTVDQLRAIVASGDQVRVLGTGHSFNRIADTPGDLVSVADLPTVMDLSTRSETVTVSAGVRYGELAGYLDSHGYALHNLGSLPHISVAGACATGTHGSGAANGVLATAVAGLEIVRAGGEVERLDRSAEDFAGSVIGLGALGVVTGLTLDVQPAYQIRQFVYDNLPYERLAGHLSDVLAAGYSVSLFTDWSGPVINQVWVKQRVGAPMPGEDLFGATPAAGPRHPVPGVDPRHSTVQLGVPGPWHTRLPHFKLEFTPSHGEELQSEYFVPAADAEAALAALYAIRRRIAPVLQISEVRAIAADGLWLSPAAGRDTVALHFTWVPDEVAVGPVLSAIEEALAPYRPRPHWGKLFRMPAATVRKLYERYDDFVALCSRVDPAGRFRNEFMNTYL